jgi:hypothetical protein
MRRPVEVPLYCEELPLKGKFRFLLGATTGGFALLGIWAGAWGGAGLAWLSGLCLTLATGGFFGLWRLSRFQTLVGRYGVRAGFWELTWNFPRAAVKSVSCAPARGWRRLFSSQQVLVELSQPAGPQRLAIPCRDVQELIEALREE